MKATNQLCAEEMHDGSQCLVCDLPFRLNEESLLVVVTDLPPTRVSQATRHS